MNQIALRGKATSSCKTKIVKSKENIPSEMSTLVMVAPVQGAPKIECQVELRALDPKVTRIMQTIKVGDQVEAVGSLATEMRWQKNEESGEMERKPIFYYVFVDQVEKIIN